MSNFYLVLEGGCVSGTRKREISEAVYRLAEQLELNASFHEVAGKDPEPTELHALFHAVKHLAQRSTHAWQVLGMPLSSPVYAQWVKFAAAKLPSGLAAYSNWAETHEALQAQLDTVMKTANGYLVQGKVLKEQIEKLTDLNAGVAKKR